MKKMIILPVTLLMVFLFFLIMRFVTWGFPWELPKVKEIAQQYLDKNYDEPMEVIGANRFLRNHYNVTAREINNPDIVFLVTLNSDKTIWKDDYVEKRIAYEIAEELNIIIKSYQEGSYAWVNFWSSFFYGDDAITPLTPEDQKITRLNNNFSYIVRYEQDIQAANYVDNLSFFMDCVAAVQKSDYEGKEISFISIKSKIKSYNDGKEPQLRFDLTREEYMSIQEQMDLIPYIEKAIADNPYYK